MWWCHGGSGLESIQARTVGNDRAEVYTAECLELERICAALSPVGLGGLVNAADISTGFAGEALLGPGLVLKENFREMFAPKAL